jgi:hypothetical protein
MLLEGCGGRCTGNGQLNDDRNPRLVLSSGFVLIGDAPVVRLVVALDGQERTGRSQLPGFTNESAKVRAAAQQAVGDSRAGSLVKLDDVVEGGGEGLLPFHGDVAQRVPTRFVPTRDAQAHDRLFIGIDHADR